MNARRLLIILALSHALGQASELHWQNGEWIGGHLMEVTEDHVVWRSEIFTEPLKVSLNVLRRVGKLPEDKPTKELFSLRMADGTHLYGKITGMDASTLTVTSARFGTMRIERSAVANIRRLSGAGMLFAAPTSTSGWIESDEQKKDKLWRVVPGAALKQVGWNRSATLPIEAPELVEMQFNLTSTVRPEFKLELKAKDNKKVTVETWVDDVVLQGRAFQNLKTLKDTDHRIALTLFWNRKTGLCAVYNADGKKLAETNLAPVEQKQATAEPEKKKPEARAGGGGLFGALIGVVQGAAQGIAQARVDVQVRGASSNIENTPMGLTLLNKGPDLKVEALRIREWDGTLPTDITDVRPRVEMADGHYLKASVIRANASVLTVRSKDKDGSKETTLTWDTVLGIEMEPPSPFFSAPSPGTELWFADGEWISGKLLHMRDEVATLMTGYSREPVAFKFGEVRRMELREVKPGTKPPELATLDTLTINKKVLHGTLNAGGEAQPRWKPVGGLNTVAMISAGEFQITRASLTQPESLLSDALFYLSSGDVVPGTLRAIDAKQVDLESDVVQLKHLPTEKVQAIQFGGAPLNLDGFEDYGWQRVRGGADLVKRNGKAALDFQPAGSWGHPAFMQVNEISFTLMNTGFTALRMRLYCDGVNPAAPSTNLLFCHMGSEACVGLQADGDGETMDRQFRLKSNGPIPVRIELGENTVEVFLGGVSARKINLTAKMRSGSGIIIEPFSMWGNGEREVKITSFSAHIASGRVAVPIVDAKSKENALTVPRFRKEDPPHHALLAANGDLLRGVIEAATAKHFAIRSGLETIQVPRDRVKAAVWFIKPEDDVSAAFEADAADPPVISHWILLNNGGRLALNVSRFADDAVIGKNALLGDCRVPLKQVHTIRSTHPEDNAAMMALRDWKLKFAPEPVLPESGGQSSPLLKQDAKPFKLPLLAGGDFDLAQEKGKVIVLDFWATWCGPCIKSLPDMIDQMSAFDAKKVRFIGINQAEAKEQVKTFLETRGWKFEVALDTNQRVGQSFGVEGIPHTIVIGPDGKVAYVKTGYEPDGAKKIAETVRKLLEK